jgi:hypothetical protein
MHVSITHYDDIIAQGTGEIITMYMVCVQYSSRSSYMLGKRYSDFSTLHAFVKDYLPSDYKFPNKSLFHNNAQFTKERRIRGFDELLKFCSKHLPLNPDFQAFLEIKDHISPIERDVITEQMKTQALENTSSGDSSHHSSQSSGSNNSGGGGGVPRRAVIKSVSLKSKVDFQNETVEEITVRTRLSQLSNFLLNQTINPNENLSSYEIAIKEKENNFRYKFHQSAPTLLFSALKTSLIAYFILILLSIIDVSHHLTITNWTRTFYTFSSITMILLFSDIRKIRKNLPKNQLQSASSSNKKKKEKKLKWNNDLKGEGGVKQDMPAGSSSPVPTSSMKNKEQTINFRKKKVTIVDS